MNRLVKFQKKVEEKTDEIFEKKLAKKITPKNHEKPTKMVQKTTKFAKNNQIFPASGGIIKRYGVI